MRAWGEMCNKKGAKEMLSKYNGEAKGDCGRERDNQMREGGN